MDFAIFNDWTFLLRWFHFLFGIVWIGILYYFNFVHGAFMAEADAASKPTVQTKLLPRALGWFRYGALGTFVTGLLILMLKGHRDGAAVYGTSWGITILLGATLATLMFLNVWLIIWPKQQVVIASFTQIGKGGQALPEAAAAGARALTASRTNALFSIPMLFFMGAASHLPISITPESNIGLLAILMAVIIGALEFNAIKGKTGPMTTIKGVIHSGLGLTVVLYVLMEVIL